MYKMYIIKPISDRYEGISMVGAETADEANQYIKEYIANKKEFFEGYSFVTEKDSMAQSKIKGMLTTGIKLRT